MTFKDIFKSSFIEHVASVSMLDMLIAMILAMLLGLFIFFIYKKTYSGVMCSASFGITLVCMTLITTLLIMAVVSNVVLSLGMVGALSIVRFRTAIKDPMDIAFLFWSIAIGIVLASGLIPLAVFGSLFIGLVLLVFANKKDEDTPYILVIHCETSEQEKEIHEFIELNVKKIRLKSKNVRKSVIELNYEVKLSNGNSDFINELSEMNGVNNAVLVSYNGDYMG